MRNMDPMGSPALPQARNSDGDMLGEKAPESEHQRGAEHGSTRTQQGEEPKHAEIRSEGRRDAGVSDPRWLHNIDHGSRPSPTWIV